MLKYNLLNEKFPLENQDSFHKVIFSILAGALYSILIFSLNIEIHSVVFGAFFILVVYGFRRIFRRLLKDWARKKNFIGLIIFSENGIEIIQDEITHLIYGEWIIKEVQIDYFQGYTTIIAADKVRNGVTQIKIESVDSSKQHLFKFLIEDRRTFEVFKEYVFTITKKPLVMGEVTKMNVGR